MINLDVNVPDPSSNALAGAPKNQLSSLSAQSFAAQLSEAISETLSKFGIDPNTFNSTFTVQRSHSSATSQFSAANDTREPAVPLGVGVNSGSSKHWYGSNPADDAYWSQQPPAVQQLREIDDADQRKQLGEELAGAGYNIDVPIMVWGWDAQKVMQARQTYGYTWVPSALQQQVSAAPGVSGGGIVPYNPNKPPSGSIRV